MNNNIRLLLQLINANADISYLLRNNLTYSQIAALFGEAMQKGFIAHVDAESGEKKVIVTGQGKVLLADNENRLKFGNQGNWISPDERNMCPQIKLDDIFLPRKKDVFF